MKSLIGVELEAIAADTLRVVQDGVVLRRAGLQCAVFPSAFLPMSVRNCIPSKWMCPTPR